MNDTGESKLPLQYEDGPDYCTVKDAQGRDFALTMQPDLMKAMERALSDEMESFMRAPASKVAPLRLCSYCKTWNSKPCGEQCCWSPTDPVHMTDVPQTLPMRQVLADALDSPTIKALCDVFETRGALNKSYSEMVADVLEPRITLAMTRPHHSTGETK